MCNAGFYFQISTDFVLTYFTIVDEFQLKDIIFKNLAKDPEDSPLKVVIATVALGMGADLRHVAQVIHAGPPQNLEGKFSTL